MMTLFFRDIEKLSAYLDGQLSQAEKTRLESRLASDRELDSALNDLRQARTILRHTPKRRAPRNFTLTPKMAGIRPPVPRAVPALSWASMVAAILFVCTVGVNLLGQISFGAAAPMAASAPLGMGGGGGGYGGGPADTQAPASAENAVMPTTTPEVTRFAAPETTATPVGVGGAEGYNTPTPGLSVTPQPEDMAKQHEPANIWPYFWLVLAVLLISAALLIRWNSLRTFRKKIVKK
jgi:anti-sigma factor RsiW